VTLWVQARLPELEIAVNYGYGRCECQRSVHRNPRVHFTFCLAIAPGQQIIYP